MALKLWSSCLYVPSTGIAGLPSAFTALGSDRDRTQDFMHVRQALCPLSYMELRRPTRGLGLVRTSSARGDCTPSLTSAEQATKSALLKEWVTDAEEFLCRARQETG